MLGIFLSLLFQVCITAMGEKLLKVVAVSCQLGRLFIKCVRQRERAGISVLS